MNKHMSSSSSINDTIMAILLLATAAIVIGGLTAISLIEAAERSRGLLLS
jgi:hypothetical protein